MITKLLSRLYWVWEVVWHSYAFIRYSVSEVASNYPPGRPIILYPFGRRTIIFTSKEACHHVLNDPKHCRNYLTRFGVESGLRELGMFNCGVIWNNDSVLWKESRGCFQKGLNSRTIEEVRGYALENVNLVFRHMPRENGAIHMMHAMRWITLNFTLVNLLGLKAKEDWSEAKYIIEAIVDYFKAWEFFFFRPRWSIRWTSPNQYHTHQQSVKKFHKISEQLLEEYESYDVSNRDGDGWKPSSCLDHAYPKYKSNVMTRTELVQLILEVLLAGVDTSSVTMFNCLGYLSDHRRWYNKVQREVDEATDSLSLPILRACLDESMRIKPVGPIIMRRAKEHDTVEGTTIHPEDQIILHLAAMNIHEVEPQEGTSAKSFDPSRFLDSTGKHPLKSLPFGFYPFGDGPKGCVGKYLAMEEMHATLYHFLRRYHVTYHTSMDALETHWDIAQQPQKPEEMQVTVQRLPKQVFLIGPSSTGKTTMLKYLTSESVFPNAKVHTEVARTLLKEMNLSRNDLQNDPKVVVRFQHAIVKEYAKRQRLVPAKDGKSHYDDEENSDTISDIDNDFDDSPPLEIFDRSAIDSIVYCQLSNDKHHHLINCHDNDEDNVNSCEELVATSYFQECLMLYRANHRSLTILFPVIEELRYDDQVRWYPPTLQEHQKEVTIFRDILHQLNVRYETLPTILTERHPFIQSLIQDFCQS